MIASPFEKNVLFHVGPVPVADVVVVTWVLMAVLTAAGWLATRKLKREPGRWQIVLELYVDAIQGQIRDTMRADPRPYLPLVGMLFLFILAANWSSLIPGIHPPTAQLETDAALALIVFVAVAYYGIRARGVWGYLKTFAEPAFIMAPLNLIDTIARTFSMMARLFGNVMSGVFIIAIVLSIAGLLVPIPLMALELLTGAIQAYIFTILAIVFIAGVVAPDTESSSNLQERNEA